MILQIYGSYNCEHCMLITTGLMRMNIPHTFYDADEIEHSNKLDELNVEILPYVAICDDEGEVVWSKSGSVTLTEIVHARQDALS